MLTAAARVTDGFAEARAEFDGLEAFLGSQEACRMTPSDLERELEKRGRKLMRQLLPAHLEVRGRGRRPSPCRAPTVWWATRSTFTNESWRRFWEGASGARRLWSGRCRPPASARCGFELAGGVYAHEVRRRAAEAAAQGCLEEVVHRLAQTTGAQVAKRQVEELVGRAEQDVRGVLPRENRVATASGEGFEPGHHGRWQGRGDA